MKRAFVALALVSVAVGQNGDAAFRKWWPGFQAAVAKHDAKAVAEGMRFPQPWENGPSVREIKSADKLTARFKIFFTTEIKKQIATKKPERLPNGNYIIIWHARGNEYSLHFAPSGSVFALDGLGEGPPNASASCGSLRQQASSPPGTSRADVTAPAIRSSPPASAREWFSYRRPAS